MNKQAYLVIGLILIVSVSGCSQYYQFNDLTKQVSSDHLGKIADKIRGMPKIENNIFTANENIKETLNLITEQSVNDLDIVNISVYIVDISDEWNDLHNLSSQNIRNEEWRTQFSRSLGIFSIRIACELGSPTKKLQLLLSLKNFFKILGENIDSYICKDIGKFNTDINHLIEFIK